MHEMIEDLYELCETIGTEIGTANEKIKMAGGELKGSDVEYIDKLTHSLKSIKAVMAMIEDEDGYSNQGGGSNRSYARGRRGGSNAGGGSNRGGSNRGSYEGSYDGSFARGRGRNARRDSMGRYSREGGYSRAADELVEQLEQMMEQAPNEKIKMEFEKLINKMENA